MLYGLSTEHVAAISNVLMQNHPVKRAILFGSRAKGTYRPGSDIDIALVGDQLTLNDLLARSIQLDDLWLPYRFDLVIYNHINEPALIEHIDRVGQTLVG